MASSAAGVKRSRSEVVTVFPAVAHNVHPFAKRIRRTSDHEAAELHAILKSDRDGFQKYGARVAFLKSLSIPDRAILGLLQGLNSDYRSFISIIDLNLYQQNILEIVNDFSERKVSMTTLNIRAHAFCMGEKDGVLASFSSFYGHQRWPCDIATYVAKNVFHSDNNLSIKVLSGGGVRDILITEWCKSYYPWFTSTSVTPPQVIFVTSGSGRNFLIPFLP